MNALLGCFVTNVVYSEYSVVVGPSHLIADVALQYLVEKSVIPDKCTLLGDMKWSDCRMTVKVVPLRKIILGHVDCKHSGCVYCIFLLFWISYDGCVLIRQCVCYQQSLGYSVTYSKPTMTDKLLCGQLTWTVGLPWKKTKSLEKRTSHVCVNILINRYLLKVSNLCAKVIPFI